MNNDDSNSPPNNLPHNLTKENAFPKLNSSVISSDDDSNSHGEMSEMFRDKGLGIKDFKISYKESRLSSGDFNGGKGENEDERRRGSLGAIGILLCLGTGGRWARCLI